jgi:hypothetical protein
MKRVGQRRWEERTGQVPIRTECWRAGCATQCTRPRIRQAGGIHERSMDGEGCSSKERRNKKRARQHRIKLLHLELVLSLAVCLLAEILNSQRPSIYNCTKPILYTIV